VITPERNTIELTKSLTSWLRNQSELFRYYINLFTFWPYKYKPENCKQCWIHTPETFHAVLQSPPVLLRFFTPGTPTCHSKDPPRASRRKPLPLPSGSHCASNDAPLPRIRRVPDDLDVNPLAMWWKYIQVLPAEHPRCNVVTSHLCFIRV